MAKRSSAIGRHLARVVGPHRGGVAGRARALHRLARAGLQRGVDDRAALVVERDLPQRRLVLGGVGLAPVQQLADAIPIRLGGQRSAVMLQVAAHVQRHRRQVQRRADQGVVEVEDA